MSRLELQALDALCCALDEERPRSAITASAWDLGMVSAGRRPSCKANGIAPVSTAQPLCVWCALERAIRGEAAPRINGDVWLQPCARHEERVEARPATNPVPNPNAGIVPAYPKGRWS